MTLLIRVPALLVLLLLAETSKAQSVYQKRVNDLYQAVDAHLTDKKTGLYYESTNHERNPNPHSWLWPLCALFQAANELETIQPGKEYMKPVESAVEQYFDPQPPVGGYQDYVLKSRPSTRFYDDNQWLAITWLDAYTRKPTQHYLDKAKLIYNFMMTGWDNQAGGGIYWKEGDKTTKNTCSNGPGAIIALKLYKITKDKAYLTTGLNIYNWNKKHLQSPEGIYYDAIKIPSLRIDKATFTYNTGTMMQSSILLYTITKDKKYLKEAQRIAQAAKAHFFKHDRLPREYWFNAVMLRAYADLYRIDKNEDWINFFKKDADLIWEKERDLSTNLVGNKRDRRLIDQGAMIEIYATLEQLDTLKK